MKNRVTIELAKENDLEYLPDVERSAARKFIEYLKLNEGNFSKTLDQNILKQSLSNKSLWVARNNADIIGFLASRTFDKFIHIDELSVSFEFQGMGIGRKFLDVLNEKAADDGIQELTLTTDKLIPWNFPYYERLEFSEVDMQECPHFLKEVLTRDNNANPVPENRVAMTKKL